MSPLCIRLAPLKVHNQRHCASHRGHNVISIILLPSPQAAVCLGYITPLYFAYVIEARAKLTFARRNGLLRSGDASAFTSHIFLGTAIEDAPVVALAYANLMALSSIVTVAAVEHL